VKPEAKTMSISIDPLTSDLLVAVTICGRVLSDLSPQLVKKLKRVGRNLARIKGRGTEYVTLNVSTREHGVDEDTWHVHIDVESSKLFAGDPEVNVKRTEILEALSSLEGVRLYAFVTARFLVKLNQLSRESIVMATFATFHRDDISLTTAGSRVRVRGGPLREIWWDISPDESEALISVEAAKEVEIVGHFIADEMRSMDEMFRHLMIGK
jgi:hypothetical protein